MSATYISSFLHIKNQEVYLNGSIFFKDEVNTDFAGFIRELYRHIGMSYPKFYKMDDLSKLALIGGEIITKNTSDSFLPEEKSIIFANKSSSLDTDYKHQEAIDTGLASPAVFVYTLPNISIGEVAIRHKIMGENSFFVSEEFDIKNMFYRTDALHLANKTKYNICAWVEYFQGNYELFLYTVEQNPILDVSSIEKMPIFAGLLIKDNKIIHHPSNIEILYTHNGRLKN
jgi:hypothetical protein